MPVFWNVLFIVGALVVVVAVLAGLVGLVVYVIPEPRKRALPRGTASERAEPPAPLMPLLTLPGLDPTKRRAASARVTQVQLSLANAEADEQDRIHRRALAEGRA